MIYEESEIRAHLRAGEDSGRGFKQIEFSGKAPRRPRRDDLADEIAAFANAGGGLLMCGVTDAGDVPGMSRAQIEALDSLLVEISTDTVKPPVRIRTYHRELNGRRLLVAEIPEGESQHDSPGGSFVRVGASKKRMTSDERLRLAQRRGQARFRSFDEQTVPETGFCTLDEGLWKPLLTAEGAADPQAALEKLALLAPDSTGTLRATVAGLLLCTANPERWLPAARIAATCYRGRDRASGQTDAQEIVGPLNRQIGAAAAFASRNMRVAARKEPGRVDLPQYSMRALFEAVVNAVVHRDYSMRGSAIRLSMFEDRMEIQSPGSLPNNLTVDSMARRQATRNEVLASNLGRMPVGGVRGGEDRQYFMERRGDGVPIILRETLELVGRPPEYELIDGAETLLTMPSAFLELNPALVALAVRSGGEPLPGVDVLLLFPNGAWRRVQSNETGQARAELHTTHLPMTLFAAARGYAARVERDWTPSRKVLTIHMDRLPGGGAVIITEGAGRIPGLSGRLNPIRDVHDRTYLYASNIAVNDGQPQPVHFLLGEWLRLTDSNGTTQQARVLDIVGRAAILEYRAGPE